jgi:hypothetical protein
VLGTPSLPGMPSDVLVAANPGDSHRCEGDRANIDALSP